MSKLSKDKYTCWYLRNREFTKMLEERKMIELADDGKYTIYISQYQLKDLLREPTLKERIAWKLADIKNWYNWKKYDLRQWLKELKNE